MIESGLIVELSNNKKYIITDSTVENGKVYYLALEVDYNTETPTDESIFFKAGENNTLIPITNNTDIEFLMAVFVMRTLPSSGWSTSEYISRSSRK